MSAQSPVAARPAELVSAGAADSARLKRVRALAKLLDNAFRVPGTNFRFGWDQIIGLVPGAGDVATGLMAAYIVTEAAKLGVPRRTLWRMVANVGIDMAGGAVPFAGDLFDFAFKAHRRNADLLRHHLQDRATEAIAPPRRS